MPRRSLRPWYRLFVWRTYFVRWEIIVILVLIVLRLFAAAVIPLHFDEAYYKLWSEHLAGGYFDHPPAVAFVIRLGTLLAGHGEFGVRFASILLALPMTWAVYRTAGRREPSSASWCGR